MEPGKGGKVDSKCKGSGTETRMYYIDIRIITETN